MARQRAFRTRFALAALFVLNLLFLPLLATGCGSEGGGGNTPTKPDPSKPTSVSLNSSAIALEAIGAAEEMKTPGEVKHLPFKWPETPAQARSGDIEPSPIGKHLKNHPWQLPRLFSRDIPPSA